MVPAGFTPDGLPVGLEMLGRPWSEADLLAAGYALERQSMARRAPSTTPPVSLPSTAELQPIRASPPDAPPVVLAGRFIWNAVTRELSYEVTMRGDPDQVILLALHRGGANGNGPVIVPLTRTGARIMRGRVRLRESDRDAAESGTGYVEVYTRTQPLGAARLTVTIAGR